MKRENVTSVSRPVITKESNKCPRTLLHEQVAELTKAGDIKQIILRSQLVNSWLSTDPHMSRQLDFVTQLNKNVEQ